MQVETDDMILFWQADSIYSNFYEPAPILAGGIEFNHSEGFFMALKAMTFGNPLLMKGTVEYISRLGPGEAKKYGRTNIPNFDEQAWNQVREEKMYSAVFEKFDQNPGLKKQMLATGNKMFVEASPYDKVWGIGLAPDDHRVLDPTQWRGDNLLGKVLNDVRSTFMELK
jgi:ribA/ribD-fused uncharacterized protein